MANIEHELKVMEIAASLVKAAIEQGQIDLSRKMKEHRKIERLAVLTTLLKVHLTDSCMYWYNDENQNENNDQNEDQDQDQDHNDENQDDDDQNQDENEDSEDEPTTWYADEDNDMVVPVEIVTQSSSDPDKTF